MENGVQYPPPYHAGCQTTIPVITPHKIPNLGSGHGRDNYNIAIASVTGVPQRIWRGAAFEKEKLSVFK